MDVSWRLGPNLIKNMPRGGCPCIIVTENVPVILPGLHCRVIPLQPVNRDGDYEQSNGLLYYYLCMTVFTGQVSLIIELEGWTDCLETEIIHGERPWA